MLDVQMLADKVSYYLKTAYCSVARDQFPFDLAFVRVMDECMVQGDARIGLKRQIGAILGKRPRKKSHDTKDPSRPVVSLPRINFTVEKATRGEVIVRCSMMNDQITYRRGDDGKVVHSANTGHPPAVAIMHGLLLAEELFLEMDKEIVDDSMVELLSPSDNLVIIIVGKRYKMVACRGNRGKNIRAQFHDMETGKRLKSSEIPAPLVKEARLVAETYFHDTRTKDLFL